MVELALYHEPFLLAWDSHGGRKMRKYKGLRNNEILVCYGISVVITKPKHDAGPGSERSICREGSIHHSEWCWQRDNWRATKDGSVINVLVQSVTLFSDGYNVQIIGYMETVMAKLSVSRFLSLMKCRSCNE